MKIKNGFVLSKIGGNTVAVATGELSKKFTGVVFLNDTGVFLWEHMKEDTTRASLLAALLEAYDVDEATALADIDRFLDKTSAAGIIDGEIA